MHHDATARLRHYLLSPPDWLKSSAIVDLVHLLSGIRPVIRTEIQSQYRENDVRRWVSRLGCYCCFDDDAFTVISRTPILCRRVLTIDRDPMEHTKALGCALGYPSCCVRAAARIGEENIDDWATEIGSKLYLGRFKVIDPSGYLQGKSAVSHVPCSPRCQRSLAMAVQALHGPFGYCLHEELHRRLASGIRL